MLQEPFTTPGKGRKPQVHVFDKKTGRTFRTSPENVLHERDFNTFEHQGTVYCLEDGFGKIEDQAAPVFRKLIARRTLVALANQNDTSPYGNLGLEVKGIEIYLPIAPDLAIAFWCPSIIEFLQTALATCEASQRKTAGVALIGVGAGADNLRTQRRQLQERIDQLRADLAAIRVERRLKNSPENMDYMNSLQIAHAERYLLSRDGDFSLATRMIADNDDYRRGLRPGLV